MTGSAIENGNWLPDMDLNHDKQIQSLLCYHYTIGQNGALRLPKLPRQSSRAFKRSHSVLGAPHSKFD